MELATATKLLRAYVLQYNFHQTPKRVHMDGNMSVVASKMVVLTTINGQNQALNMYLTSLISRFESILGRLDLARLDKYLATSL